MDNDFVCWKDWFTEKYRELSDSRFWSFKVALNIAFQRGFTNFVETGTTRLVDDWGGGMSTLVLGDYCKHYGKHLWTIDIDPKCIEVAQQITSEFKDNITYVVNDSLYFLQTFNQQVDFLYLDSLDCPEYDAPDSPRLKQAQEHQLNELKAAWDKLAPNAIVLLDDNGFENGGKAKLSREYLKEKGWTELVSFQQSLWIKI
jgi:SAM-dependent methyltransferase